MTSFGPIHPRIGHTLTSSVLVGACSEAKIEGLVWHDLRATYGTRLGEAGFNAYDIAKLMGHASISTQPAIRSESSDWLW